MGWSDFTGFFSKAASSVGDFFTKTVPKAAESIYNEAKSLVTGYASGVKEVTLHTVDAVGGLGNRIVSGAENVIITGEKTIGHSVESLGSSLSMPLMLLGGAALIFMMSNQKR